MRKLETTFKSFLQATVCLLNGSCSVTYRYQMLSDIWFKIYVVLCVAWSWAQWSLWVSSNSGYSIILQFYVNSVDIYRWVRHHLNIDRNRSSYLFWMWWAKAAFKHLLIVKGVQHNLILCRFIKRPLQFVRQNVSWTAAQYHSEISVK